MEGQPVVPVVLGQRHRVRVVLLAGGAPGPPDHDQGHAAAGAHHLVPHLRRLDRGHVVGARAGVGAVHPRGGRVGRRGPALQLGRQLRGRGEVRIGAAPGVVVPLQQLLGGQALGPGRLDPRLGQVAADHQALLHEQLLRASVGREERVSHLPRAVDEAHIHRDGPLAARAGDRQREGAGPLPGAARVDVRLQGEGERPSDLDRLAQGPHDRRVGRRQVRGGGVGVEASDLGEDELEADEADQGGGRGQRNQDPEPAALLLRLGRRPVQLEAPRVLSGGQARSLVLREDDAAAAALGRRSALVFAALRADREVHGGLLGSRTSAAPGRCQLLRTVLFPPGTGAGPP